MACPISHAKMSRLCLTYYEDWNLSDELQRFRFPLCVFLEYQLKLCVHFQRRTDWLYASIVAKLIQMQPQQ